MKTENLKNWGAFIAFLILAAISCWATEHSFHLLIKWMPEPFVWGLTIAFFIVASYGTKMIVDALNKDLWMDHRRRTFWIGVVLAFIFWLLMSMPTNTHTFFYNHNIGNKAKNPVSARSAEQIVHVFKVVNVQRHYTVSGSATFGIFEVFIELKCIFRSGQPVKARYSVKRKRFFTEYPVSYQQHCNRHCYH